MPRVFNDAFNSGVTVYVCPIAQKGYVYFILFPFFTLQNISMRHYSSALAMELLQYCTKPLIPLRNKSISKMIDYTDNIVDFALVGFIT